MNYKFNLLHHVGVVAKRVCAAAAETAHEGDDNTPSGPTGWVVKKRENDIKLKYHMLSWTIPLYGEEDKHLGKTYRDEL